MSHNLIAYIPTLNQRHIDWFREHRTSDLFLISQSDAEKLLPRLKRNLAALPTSMVAEFIHAYDLVRRVSVYDCNWDDDPDLSSPVWREWVLPDEDVSHAFAEKYLLPRGCVVRFEMIWARWDMLAVVAQQPILHDVEISFNELNVEFMNEAKEVAKRSPDWWRQIGALIVDASGNRLVSACNTHMPNEYETYIFGDPRINVDAGEVGKYTSSHAEDTAINLCARHGYKTQGGKIYVNVFPCEGCARKIVTSGISSVYFSEGYSSLNAQDVLRTHGVKIVQVK